MTKRKNAPFIAFYPSDWIAGVRLLPTVERALYHEICLAIWDTGVGVEPCDLRMLLPETPERLKQAMATLLRLGKIIEADGRYVNKRALAEFAKATKRREDGRKAVAARKDRATSEGTTVPTTVATPVPTPVVTNQNQNQSHIQNQIQKPEKEEAERAREATPADHFSAQYDPAFKTLVAKLKTTYPEHAGRSRWGEAEQGIVELRKLGYTYAHILDAVERLRHYHEVRGDVGTRYVMSPATFMADAENIDNEWKPPKPERRKTRTEEAAEHNYETFQALKEDRNETGRPGRVRQVDSGGGDVQRAHAASS